MGIWVVPGHGCHETGFFCLELERKKHCGNIDTGSQFMAIIQTIVGRFK